MKNEIKLSRHNLLMICDIILIYWSIGVLKSLGLHWISAPALINPKSGHFSEIRPSLAAAKFLAGFGGCKFQICQVVYLQF